MTRITSVQQTLTIVENKDRGERSRFCIEVVSDSQGLVHARPFRCTEEGSGIVELIWTVRLDDTV